MAKNKKSYRSDSLGAKSWKRLKKNIPAMVGLIFIIFASILAILGYLITPDKSPDANEQVLEISNQSPGFKVNMLTVKKNRAAPKGSIFHTMMNGKRSEYTLVPIAEHKFDDQGKIVVTTYAGELRKGDAKSYDLADVVFAKSVSNETVSVANGHISYFDINEKPQSASIEELKDIVLKEHINPKKYYLGTDRFGRDILSRLLIGVRISISVGLVAVVISLFIGVILGSLAGFYSAYPPKVTIWTWLSFILAIVAYFVILGKTSHLYQDSSFIFVVFLFLVQIIAAVIAFFLLSKGLNLVLGKLFPKLYTLPVDDLIMWLVNVIWSIPTILLAMSLGFTLSKIIDGFWVIYVAVGLSMWVELARIVRGQVLSIREKEFVEASHSLGFNNTRTIFRHILPNIIGPIMVITAANFATAILVESGLSFLGIGVQPPTPSWGSMLKQHFDYLTTDKYILTLVPGIAIMLMVLAFNILGNGIRDALDVKGRL